MATTTGRDPIQRDFAQRYVLQVVGWRVGVELDRRAPRVTSDSIA